MTNTTLIGKTARHINAPEKQMTIVKVHGNIATCKVSEPYTIYQRTVIDKQVCLLSKLVIELL
jgi:hypothetical protein